MAVGAAIGTVGNRRRNKAAQQQAAQVEEQAAGATPATQEQIGKFKNAFSVALKPMTTWLNSDGLDINERI